MPSIFSKNCIVAGAIDFYCLLCEKRFRTEEEAIAHIGEYHHKTQLSSTSYYEKYKDDRIKKIKTLYFCELCNTTFPTAIKVKLHVGEENHIEKKTITKITRINNNIVVSGSIVIDEDTWNGLVEENCVICNVEVDNKVTHNSSQSHVLNLIKSEVLFGQQGTVYRELDAGFFQCLNCNIMLSQHELTQHFQTSQRHSDNMLKYLSSKKDNIERTAYTNKTENVKQSTKETVEDTETVDVKEEDRDTLPFRTGMRSNGTDKTTLFTKPVLRNGKDQTSGPSSASSKDKLETFAKKHGLSPNRADNSFYCKVCTRRIPATLADLKTHVLSKGHQEKASIKACNTEMLLTEPKTVSAEEFIKELELIEDENDLSIVVNSKFFITAPAFTLIGKYKNKCIICLACHIDLEPEIILEHVSSKRHIESMQKGLVVTSLEDEFVRQISNENYLCSFCVSLEKDWDDMLDHLQTEEHRIKKAAAKKCMDQNKSKSSMKVCKKDCNDGLTLAEFIERYKMFQFFCQHRTF